MKILEGFSKVLELELCLIHSLLDFNVTRTHIQLLVYTEVKGD